LLNPALGRIAEQLSKRVFEVTAQELPYELASLSFNHDSLIARVSLASFRIERLADSGFAENRFYSAAPLPTKDHIEFLNEFEAALQS
jgi:hypothetical protein